MTPEFDMKSDRLNRGLTTREIAEQIGIPEATYRRAENGYGVRPKHAKMIADFYGYKVTDMWPIGDAA